TYKVMGQALPELVDQVVEVVQRHAPGDYSPTVNRAAKATTTRSLSPLMPPILNRLKRCTKNWAILISCEWYCNTSRRLPGLIRVTPRLPRCDILG
ncbi:hypothetical protein SEE8A_004742, partial [Salmonella enterica subsp. enterica serovar Enteritidis str. SE8a]